MPERSLLLIVAGLLVFSLLSACGSPGSTGTPSPSINTSPISITPTIQPTQPAGAHEVSLGNCKQEAPAPVVSASAPGAQTIYVGSFDSLYAINASNGAQQWCKRATLSGAFPCPGRSCPRPPLMLFGRPAVANGAVYVCVWGYGGYTYALRASDGSPLWRVKTDCTVDSSPFADYATPLLDHDVVYSATYALRVQDGAIFWHTSLGVAFQRLVNGVIYACSEDTVYALNARDGSLLWRYEVPDRAPLSGRLTVDGGHVYFGTLDSVSVNNGALYMLNASSGALLWRFTQGAYYDINTLPTLVFVIGRDRAIYALNSSNGAIRWSFKLASFIYASSVDGHKTLFVSADGIYALRADSGAVIWYQAFHADQSVDFTPVTAGNSVVYLGRTDGRGNSVLYALNAGTGAEYWHMGQFNQVTPLTVSEAKRN
jgi:outer membrane protein assembly factor BamB